MKLKFLGHDERYIVEQSLMTLFPLEKPIYDAVQPGDDLKIGKEKNNGKANIMSWFKCHC